MIESRPFGEGVQNPAYWPVAKFLNKKKPAVVPQLPVFFTADQRSALLIKRAKVEQQREAQRVVQWVALVGGWD